MLTLSTLLSSSGACELGRRVDQFRSNVTIYGYHACYQPELSIAVESRDVNLVFGKIS